MGSLTTHVLDIAHGRPAAGVSISLFAVGEGERTLVGAATTNDDGRVDAPLLMGAAFVAQTYEIVFEIGAYFSGRAVPTDDPPFLDAVTVRFTVADPAAHYHVPLLATPWSYTTYRGS